MESLIKSLLLGASGIIVLMLGWVAVQAMWRRSFRQHLSDDDVLAERRSCRNCGCTTQCERGVKIVEEIN